MVWGLEMQTSQGHDLHYNGYLLLMHHDVLYLSTYNYYRSNFFVNGNRIKYIQQKTKKVSMSK